MPALAKSVGAGGINTKSDVRTVQTLLNNFVSGLGLPALVVDGDCGKGTIKAIRKFQAQVVGQQNPDGRIDPGGQSFKALIGTPLASPRSADPALLSGATWWHANQARFANSDKTADLIPEFRDKVDRFIAAMRAAGANVRVTSTRRNRIRAYLMHYSFQVSSGAVAARDVPPEPGCQILWDHGSIAKSKAAAQEMKDLFNIAFKPSLRSRHIDGKAIDMTISWTGTLNMVDGTGQTVAVPPPGQGNLNVKLHRVGASYGVIKLLSDPPHWSTDGH